MVESVHAHAGAAAMSPRTRARGERIRRVLAERRRRMETRGGPGCKTQTAVLVAVQMAVRRWSLPDEVWDIVASHLSLQDLVRLCMVSRQLCRVAREHRTPDRTPIFSDDPAAHEVIWPHLPFGTEFRHGDHVWSVHGDGAGCLYTGCCDGVARRIDARTGLVLREYPHGAAGAGVGVGAQRWWSDAGAPVSGDCVLCVHVDGEGLYTGCGDGVARKIDVGTGELLWACVHGGWVRSVVVCGEHVCTGSDDGCARKLDARTGEVLWTCASHGGYVVSVHMDAQGSVYTGCADGKVRMLDADTGEVLWECEHGRYVNSVFAEGGWVFTGCFDGKARRLDAHTGRVDREYPPCLAGVRAVCAAEGYLFTGCYDKKARKIHAETGEVVWECAHTDWVYSVHAEEGVLYTGSRGMVARKIVL